VSSSKNPRIHHRPDIWPIPPLQQGEVVFFGGTPGALREFKDLATRLDQPFMVSGQIVHDVTKTNIVLHVDCTAESVRSSGRPARIIVREMRPNSCQADPAVGSSPPPSRA
jgi:hypothetical protein